MARLLEMQGIATVTGQGVLTLWSSSGGLRVVRKAIVRVARVRFCFTVGRVLAIAFYSEPTTRPDCRSSYYSRGIRDCVTEGCA